MDKKTISADKAKLRRLAEKAEEETADHNDDLSEKSPEDIASLIHELRVHQIELEMQNEELRRTQGELEKTRNRYSHLYDFSPVGYFAISEKGIIEEANLTIASMLKVDRGVLIGKPLTQFILKDDQDIYYKHKQCLMKTEAPQVCELRLLANGRPEFYARLECLILKTKGKDIGEIRVAVSDITVLKQTENKLREREAFSRTLIDAIPIPVFYKGMDGRYLGFNKAFETFFGRTREELIGKSVFDINPSDLAARYHAQDEQLLKYGGSQQYESQVKTVQEETRDVIFYKSSFSDKIGSITGLIGAIVDITDRNAAEKLLKDSQEKFKSMVDNIGIGVSLISPKMEVLELNRQMREWFHGVNPGNLLICHSVFNDPPLDSICDSCPTEQTLRDGKTHETIIDKTYDGETRSYRIISSPLTSGDGEVTAAIEMLEDITERLRLEDQLRQAQKLESIGNLAGGIAHDFNNILSSIIGFTELSLDEVTKGSNLEDNLQEVYTAGKRAKELVSQILAFARKTNEDVKPVNIGEIVRETLKLIRASTPADIEIRKMINSDSLVVGNSTLLQQGLMNLASNALDAMENKGGILEVAVSNVVVDESFAEDHKLLGPGDYVKIIVSDTGTGIPAEVIKSIFEPYFTTKTTGRGTGLGLASVHGTVKKYGGAIMVESQPGQGSIFTILLPVTRRQEVMHPYQPEAVPHGSEKILFVDDELPIARMGQLVLERLGYKVTIRTSSIEALELFQAKPNWFDLVITDMTMPNLTGDKLAIELLKVRRNIPVILCTGYSKRVSEEKASELGIKAFAYKPMVKSDLANTVRKVLDEAKQ